MIKIENKDIDKIQKSYTRKVCKEFSRRIIVLENVIQLLQYSSPINLSDIDWNNDRTALRAVIGDSNIKSKDNATLLANFNSFRKISGVRLNILSSDLLIITRGIKDLVSEKPENLKTLQTQIKTNTSIVQGDELIKYLFNYDYYYDDYIVPIAEKLDLGVCPYCNRNYITHLQGRRKKRVIGPTFDHFFDKATNPYLALSFYNLIPSCSVCNSNLKNQKEFYLDRHLHPYINDANDDFSFDFNLDLLSKHSNSKIIFKPKIKYKVDKKSDEYRRLKGDGSKNSGSINVFKLKEIYEKHYDTVEEIHEKFDKNSHHYIKSISAHLESMGVPEEELYRYHFGNYYNKEDFNKRPLAKLTKDIYEKMKAISPLYK